METQTQSKSERALKTMLDYYGSLDAVKRELTDFFFAYASGEVFNGLDQESRWTIASNFGFVLDYFDTLELERENQIYHHGNTN